MATRYVMTHAGGVAQEERQITWDGATFRGTVVSGYIEQRLRGSAGALFTLEKADTSTAFAMLYVEADNKIYIGPLYGSTADLIYTGVTSIACDVGATITEFSIDGTLADNSDAALPTEKAVKTFVGAYLNGLTADTDPDDSDVAHIYSADATADRKITLANLKTYFQSGASGAVTFNEPAGDNSAGTQALFDSATVGESVAFPDLLYLKSDGKWWKADADASTTMPCLRMALESKTADQTCSMLVAGRVRDDDWTWTVGGIIYASTTTGGLTQTAPTGTADIVQQVGIAYHADKMIFAPDMTQLEIV
jgi:hypothetical protein